MGFEVNDDWLFFCFLISLICRIYQFCYLLFPRQIPHFWQKRSAPFSWSGSQFFHPHAWFRRRQCMLNVGTSGGSPLLSGVVSLYATIRKLSSNSTPWCSYLILAPSRDIFFFFWFGRIMFIWCFWCWWCCCVTLLLSVVGVRLVFLWWGWWYFYIFLFCSCFCSFEVFLDVLYWLDSVSGSLEVALCWLHVRHLQNRVKNLIKNIMGMFVN